MSHFKNLLSISLTILMVSVVSAHDIVPDNHAAAEHKPTIIQQGGNTPPVIQIAPPRHGISHNQFEQFSTHNGAVFANNQQAVPHPLNPTNGQIQGNPNLKNGTAKIIINEVTGKKASDLHGHITVAGDKADLIFSNPNGIRLNGVTISNTNRAVMTTGKLRFDEQHQLQGYSVNQGTITVDGKGANFTNVDRVDLLARSIELNQKIWAKKSLNIITGTNEITHDTLAISAHKDNDNAPVVAIDIAELGGMYADKIHLVGTEKGMGVTTDDTYEILADNGFMLDLRKQLIVEQKKETSADDDDHDNDIDNPHHKHGVIHVDDQIDRIYLGYGHYMDFYYPEIHQQIHGGYLNNGEQGDIIFSPDLQQHSGIPLSDNDIMSPLIHPVSISSSIPGASTEQDFPHLLDSPQPPAKVTITTTDTASDHSNVVPTIIDEDNHPSSNGNVFGQVISGVGIGGGASILGGHLMGTGVVTNPWGLNPISNNTVNNSQANNTSTAGSTASNTDYTSAVAGTVAASSGAGSWANMAAKPGTSTSNIAPNTTISLVKPNNNLWQLAPNRQKNTYWNSYSENHVFQGDKHGGGHLYGTANSTNSKFPKNWKITDIKDVVDRVINNPKTTWRPSVNGNKSVTTLFSVDHQTVKIVMDPKSLNIITTYPVNITARVPNYQFSHAMSNQLPPLGKPNISHEISNNILP